MTLDEAIIHAEEVADRCAITDGNIQCEDEHRQLAEWLKELKQLREQTRWIPVSEPPKEEGRYICDYGDCIDFGSYHDGHWYIQGAVAYMPLPQPYKGESEDKG